MRRRTFFGIVGAGAAVAALPLAGSVARADAGGGPIGRPASAARGNVEWLLGGLVGHALPGGFRVASVSEIDRGAVTITLASGSGTLAHVQVFRRSPLSTGLATTRLLDLRLMNGADGAHDTHEGAGVAVMTLASRIRRIEQSVLSSGLAADQRASLRGLTTHEQRLFLHGGFGGSVRAAESA